MQPNAKDLLIEKHSFIFFASFLRKWKRVWPVQRGREGRTSGRQTFRAEPEITISILLGQLFDCHKCCLNTYALKFGNFVSTSPPSFYQGQKSCCLGQRHKQKRPQIFVASEMMTGYFEAKYWASIIGFIYRLPGLTVISKTRFWWRGWPGATSSWAWKRSHCTI